MLADKQERLLELWIDEESISDVIDAISAICFEKGERLNSPEWTNLGIYLETVAEKIEKGSI